MSKEQKKLLNKAQNLANALTKLEKNLQPLLAQNFSASLDTLDVFQKAKLQVALPYVINDLVFIYLRAKGINPNTHPVVQELSRVREYFGKIKHAEEVDKKRRMEIDKEAAGRFIKHAIASVNFSSRPKLIEDRQEGPSEPIPTKVTDKMRERERYLKAVRESDDDEDDVMLQIIDDDEERGDGLIVQEEATPSSSSSSRPVAPVDKQEDSGSKKRKMPVDTFTGGASYPAPSKRSKKLEQVMAQDVHSASSSRASSVSLAASDSDPKPAGEASKKKKKRSKAKKSKTNSQNEKTA